MLLKRAHTAHSYTIIRDNRGSDKNAYMRSKCGTFLVCNHEAFNINISFYDMIGVWTFIISSAEMFEKLFRRKHFKVNIEGMYLLY